ncbi:putative bifunctional diguanylate cyclase/phosphodiesterase [Celeribacter sp.]|uniref:putative bifunctional diguanylate cyclase/phosphodiesterase n=1 Tax=Celeribacter sp. TaxID=1890673 RepID=UPI003A8CDA4A
MRKRLSSKLTELKPILSGPHVLAFLPALFLGAFWFGGEVALIVAAVLVPTVLYALSADLTGASPRDIDGVTGLPLRRSVIEALDQTLNARSLTGRTTACLMVEIDNLNAIAAGVGPEVADGLVRIVGRRLSDVLREHDTVARLDGSRFAVALAPVRCADLETMIQLSARIQSALMEPFSVDGAKVYASACIGFCTPNRAPAQSGAAYLDAAEAALLDALHNGPGSIRAFSKDTALRPCSLTVDPDGVASALENGQIVPWFQPQVSTDTGEVTGLEALARWECPDRGVIPPEKFLPAVEELGLMDRLGEVIRFRAFSALRKWEDEGLILPSVSINFTSSELANPKLVDKLRWELDRFNLTPDRLGGEILENVIVASENDIIPRNIRALQTMGCRIDLDDYGTGHASIANIRRFAVNRIKIDRTYVTRCDIDRSQQDMLAAILTMAERLDLETLAEGVETLGEHAMLAQLGCGFVQGFSISRPLPESKLKGWVDAHNRKLGQTPRIGRRAG